VANNRTQEVREGLPTTRADRCRLESKRGSPEVQFRNLAQEPTACLRSGQVSELTCTTVGKRGANRE
jgi:hypothetical protein